MEVSYVRLEGMRQATSWHLHSAVNEALTLAKSHGGEGPRRPCVGERKFQY